VQVPQARVTYYHLELPAHDVLEADGLPVESFLDVRDGSKYADRARGRPVLQDHTALRWEAFGCARLVVTGPELAAARALVAGFAVQQAPPDRYFFKDVGAFADDMGRDHSAVKKSALDLVKKLNVSARRDASQREIIRA
jgi:Hint domain-containing protein